MTGISRGMGIAIAAMVGVVALSNYVVQFEIFTHAVLVGSPGTELEFAL